MPAGSRRRTARFTRMTNASSGTKSAPRGPAALRSASRMSWSAMPSRAPMLATRRAKCWSNTMPMREPPTSIGSETTSSERPSMTSTKLAAKRESSESRSAPCVAVDWACTGSPRASRSLVMSSSIAVILDLISGRLRRTLAMRMALSRAMRKGIPMRPATDLYAAWVAKNSCSLARAASTEVASTISRWLRQTTPTKPRRSGITRPRSTSMASVPRSMRSSLVRTPIVRSPSGSTSCASWSASLFVMSVLAADTARMMAEGLRMNSRHKSRTCSSMSAGWSPTGRRVMPGRSTSVRLRTLGEKILRVMGVELMPLFRPAIRSVSRAISLRISPKS
mmetsp:Transcript_316/g.1058  ORF Transcript_316/g.1058 Transcript_316/m.1058 type:complete len:336 (-) Transcript_316:474-1481(-)